MLGLDEKENPCLSTLVKIDTFDVAHMHLQQYNCATLTFMKKFECFCFSNPAAAVSSLHDIKLLF